MNNEEQLAKQFTEYQEVGKEHPDVDVASLMMHALDDTHQDLVSGRQKKIAYVVSIGAPPLGLLFALKFYFFDESDDARHVALMCVLLTAIGGVLFWISVKMFFSSAGVSVNQIQQITPQDILELQQ